MKTGEQAVLFLFYGFEIATFLSLISENHINLFTNNDNQCEVFLKKHVKALKKSLNYKTDLI